MDHQERLLPSCPSIHAVEAHRSKTDAISSKLIPLTEEGEKEPLLGSVKVNVGGSDNASSKKKKWNWRSLALATVLWFATLFISAAYSMIAPFFPKEAASKGCSPLIIGVIISISPLCMFITSPVFGYQLPKIGIRFSILSGVLLVGGAFTLLGFLVDMPYGWVFITFAILLRMTEGVGSSLSITAINTLLPELYPNRIGFITGLFEVGGGLGYAMGPAVGGLLYTLNGFMLPFVCTGCIILAFIPPIFLLSTQTKCQSKVLPLRTLFKISSNFVFLLLLLGQVFCLAGLGFFNPTLQPFLSDQFGLSEEKIGLVFMAGPGVYMLLALLFGGLADKFGTRGFIIYGFFVTGVSFFLMGPAHFITTPRLWLTIASFALMGAGIAPAFIPMYTDLLNIAHSKHPEEDKEVITGVVSGLSSAAISLGEFIGPLLGGSITQFTDFRTASMLFGQIIIAEGLLVLGVTLIDKLHLRR